jgi:tripartite-type tricarboxylate transporter receptor subunit TctC
MALISGAVALPQVQAGKLRAIGVGTAERVSFLPDAPTVIEATGESDFLIGPWNGIIGPAGMNPDVVKKLETAIQEVLNSEKTKETMLGHGQYPFLGTGEDFSRYIDAQQKHWAAVIENAQLKKLD